MRFKITQLELACFTLKKTQIKRKKVLLRLANKYLNKKPEIAYYLNLGPLPISLRYQLPDNNFDYSKRNLELPDNLWEI